MKRLLTRCAAFGAGLAWTSLLLAAEPNVFAPQSPPVRGTMAAYFDEAEKKEEAAAPAAAEPAPAEESAAPTNECAEPAADGCADAAEPECGDEAGGCGDGCGSTGCFGDDWCDLGLEKCWPFSCCCAPGDPWKLQSSPCCDGTTYGGWLSMGYYTNNDPLSVQDNDLLSFWDNPNDLNFDQQWLYFEKLANTDCGWGLGYRVDIVYGVDAQKTQSFGNSGAGSANGPQGYDNGWDNGKYGWALPQSYIELANGDLSVKIGHFYTLVGYEVVPKTGNFFYSHSFTQFNSEPFMHTGALATYKVSDDLSVMAGWVLGWDTGYDQFGDGNAVHAGFIKQMNENVKYSYMMTGGDLGWRGDGYSHSNIVDFTLSSKWQYVFQTDLLDSSASEAVPEALSYGVVQYAFYTINDCWKWGTRVEWWKSNQVTGETSSFNAVTTGLNYKATANLLVRPEVKWNWTPSDQAFENATGGDFNDTLFGVDAIYTF